MRPGRVQPSEAEGKSSLPVTVPVRLSAEDEKLLWRLDQHEPAATVQRAFFDSVLRAGEQALFSEYDADDVALVFGRPGEVLSSAVRAEFLAEQKGPEYEKWLGKVRQLTIGIRAKAETYPAPGWDEPSWEDFEAVVGRRLDVESAKADVRKYVSAGLRRLEGKLPTITARRVALHALLKVAEERGRYDGASEVATAARNAVPPDPGQTRPSGR